VNLIRELLGNADDFYWEILRSLDLIVSDRRHVEFALERANERLLPRIPVCPIVSSPHHPSFHPSGITALPVARAHFFALVSGRVTG